jgi:hypothetical protein
MEQFKLSEHYSNLVQHVLEPLDRRAFETFKRVIPTEPYEIVQAQMMSKVIDLIKAEIDSLIQLGYLAKEALKSTTEGGSYE